MFDQVLARTMEEICNIKSNNHRGKVNKKFKKFRNSNFLTDLHLICQDGTVSVHKLLFLVNLPNFAKYLCDSCDQHSEISVILPDIEKSDLQKGIKNLYSYGSVSDLEELLGLKKERNHEIDKEMKTDEAFSGSNPIMTENTKLD